MKAKRDRGDQGKSPAHLRWARRVTKRWQANTLDGKTPGEYRTHLWPMVPKSGPSTDGNANLVLNWQFVVFAVKFATRIISKFEFFCWTAREARQVY